MPLSPPSGRMKAPAELHLPVSPPVSPPQDTNPWPVAATQHPAMILPTGSLIPSLTPCCSLATKLTPDAPWSKPTAQEDLGAMVGFCQGEVKQHAGLGSEDHSSSASF